MLRRVYVGEEGIGPHYARGRLCVDGVDVGVDGECSFQKVNAQIEAAACLHEVLHFLVGLRAAEVFVKIQKHQFGHEQTGRARHLAADYFGGKHFRAVARAAQLGGISEAVVGLHEQRQGAALAQGRNVACHGLMPQWVHFHVVVRL